MTMIRREALIGAAIAAVLTIGASSGATGTDGHARYAAFSALNHSPVHYVLGTLRACSDTALGLAFDVVGGVEGALKQL